MYKRQGITDPVSAGNHPVVPVLYSFDLQSYLIIHGSEVAHVIGSTVRTNVIRF